MEGKIVKVIEVVDTREFDEDLEVRLPGTGREHECDRCGRLHEVWVTVELDNGEQAVIGTGCARRDEMAMVRRAVNRAARRDKLARQLARLKADIEVVERIAAEVAALPLPPVEFVEAATTKYGTQYTRWAMGDVYVKQLEPGDLIPRAA